MKSVLEEAGSAVERSARFDIYGEGKRLNILHRGILDPKTWDEVHRLTRIVRNYVEEIIEEHL